MDRDVVHNVRKLMESRSARLQLYKLNQDAALAGVEAGSEAERQAVDGLVLGAVALKVVA